MFLILIILTAILGFGVIVYAYCKTRDPFHPIILTVPMFLVLYVCLPLKLLYDGHLEDFLTDQELEIVPTDQSTWSFKLLSRLFADVFKAKSTHSSTPWTCLQTYLQRF